MQNFLTTLFADAIADMRRLAVFTLPGARLRHFSSITAAALHAAKAAETQDVYFGVGLAGANFSKHRFAKDIVAVPGLWADLDFAKPGNGKQYPPTLDAALGVLAKLPFLPSLIVHTGHGLHVYWLFKEAWTLDSDDERQRAKRLVEGWQDHVRGVCAASGWTMDNSADLARVLRLPGTFNRKGPEPVQVRVLEEHPARRYNPTDFEPFAAAAPPTAQPSTPAGSRPGDEFNARGDVRPILLKHGWTLARDGQNEHWTRPGKASGTSATLKDGLFYVFSSNAAPFEANQGYTPFAVYALLEHGGDYAKAAAALRAEGFGQDSPEQDVDLSALLPKPADDSPPPDPDPGPLPEELLRIPGFVSELVDHCLETAPYPNPVMAFAGALALQAFLAGRRVRDPGDNRTNLYLLGLAHSSAGKDWPRKLNTRIAHQVGMSGALGERFASGEGIQDALFTEPCMLFQTDEIDGLLQSINKAQDGRHETIMSTLLTMYSSANVVFPMRRKAGQDSPGVIDQPCLVIFGTAIPPHYYEALSERMLTNGLFARMIILESGPRPKGQEARIAELPPRVLATAKWWADYLPGTGNLRDWHPKPAIVEHTDDARRLLIAAREQAEDEYAKCERQGDPVGTTVWGRASEQARKLALLYAISASHQNPRIDLTAAQWATRFAMHQTRRMLFMAQEHVAENPFHAECLKLLRKLRQAPGQQLPHAVLLKRMKLDARTFADLITTLQQRGDISVDVQPTGEGRWPVRTYRMTTGDTP